MSWKFVASLSLQKIIINTKKTPNVFSVIWCHFPTWQFSKTCHRSWKQVQIPGQTINLSFKALPSTVRPSSGSIHPNPPPRSSFLSRLLLVISLGYVKKAFPASPGYRCGHRFSLNWGFWGKTNMGVLGDVHLLISYWFRKNNKENRRSEN